MWTPADEVLSPLVESSIFATSDINIMKEFVILVIVTSTPCPPSMLMAVHLVSCCRLSAGKKGRPPLSPSLPGNREFCTFDFQGTVESTDRVA